MGDLFTSQTDLLVLAVLRTGPAHGYAIIEAIRTRSGGRFDLPEGTIYPVLHRLEAKALLVSRWASADGRRRRIYELSATGREAVVARRADWNDFATAMNAVVGAFA